MTAEAIGASSTDEPKLPTKVPILVYDGDCGFCTGAASWIERKWPTTEGPVALAWQELSSASLASFGLSRNDVAREAWWIEPGGTRESGHRAIGASLKAAAGMWGFIGQSILIRIVTPIGRVSYRALARHRHRLPGAAADSRLR